MVKYLSLRDYKEGTKGCFRESAIYFYVKREMDNLFPVKRDWSTSRGRDSWHYIYSWNEIQVV